ncbi:hypothetical protein ACFC1T_08720 [Kitasatospora sp. NPDC056076]|uniref:hypothetical protein n=1 Tax=Kitasatospora sp. NPDC056076 TaxID=3345703 RepID=UPI0035D5ACD3
MTGVLVRMEMLVAPLLDGEPDGEGLYLEWEAVPDAAGYRLERQAGDGPWALIADDFPPGCCWFAEEEPPEGVTHAYRVAALAAGGARSPWSEVFWIEG